MKEAGPPFGRRAAHTIANLRACRPADPEAPVMIPGDPERRRRAERLACGLPLAPDAWESILSSGASKGLDRAEMLAVAEV